jgi:hypothetical protein
MFMPSEVEANKVCLEFKLGGLSRKYDFANHPQSFCFFFRLGKICVGIYIQLTDV